MWDRGNTLKKMFMSPISYWPSALHIVDEYRTFQLPKGPNKQLDVQPNASLCNPKCFQVALHVFQTYKTIILKFHEVMNRDGTV